MVGIRLMIIMALVGGIIAYIADKMGTKIGKKKMTIFGLRPKHTSILLTVLSGMLIALVSITVVTISSESARTALFGMDKIQKELKALNAEKEQASMALTVARGNVAEKNAKIAVLDEQIKASLEAKERMESELAGVNEKYNAAQAEVESLSQAKQQLTNDISKLEKITESLHKGIVNLREGKVFYRAGEVVYATVLKGGMGSVKNKEQIGWMLDNANQAALQRLGDLMPEKPIQVIWISKEYLDDTLNVLNKNNKDYLCRLRTIANIMVGELVLCELEMVENKLIYPKGAEVFSANYDAATMKMTPDQAIMEFLTNVNHASVAAGVMPDPVSGKVGKVDAETIVQATNQMKACTGRYKVTAYARGDITTAGPVWVGIQIKQEKPVEQSYDES